MKDRNIEKLLNELADAQTQQIPSGLADNIKRQIPAQLTRHKNRLDTVNIIIQLRVNKLAAAAVIILSMVLLANIFGSRDPGSRGLLQESKLLIRYFFEDKNNPVTTILEESPVFYESLVRQGKEAVYYGDDIGAPDGNSVLVHWRLEDGSYKVIFTDLSTRAVSADELIKLQAKMLQKR